MLCLQTVRGVSQAPIPTHGSVFETFCVEIMIKWKRYPRHRVYVARIFRIKVLRRQDEERPPTPPYPPDHVPRLAPKIDNVPLKYHFFGAPAAREYDYSVLQNLLSFSANSFRPAIHSFKQRFWDVLVENISRFQTFCMRKLNQNHVTHDPSRSCEMKQKTVARCSQNLPQSAIAASRAEG